MAIRLIIDVLGRSSAFITYDLDQSLVTFGRSKSCHIELDHQGVSRRHFMIKFLDDAYVLLDEGSRHGTILDGRKLEPHQAYPLGALHTVEVPGFLIKIECDGQKPTLERTTVVARKLLDELLQGELLPRSCPSLKTKDGQYNFCFVEEKASFVLGCSLDADFVVDVEGFSKKHLSFARDIYGIRLIPLPLHDVMVDGELVIEPQILSHGAIIKIAALELIYQEYPDEDLDLGPAVEKKEENPPSEELTLPVNEMPAEVKPTVAKASHEPQSRSLLIMADRLFLIAFIAVLAGISVFFLEWI